jgi:SAM-dependent methyltransferase
MKSDLLRGLLQARRQCGVASGCVDDRRAFLLSLSAMAEFDDDTVSSPALPPPQMMQMVAGTPDAKWFVGSGQQSVRDLSRALAAVGRSLDSFTDALDFGCGCGRMTRWLMDQPFSLTGIDTQPELIDWCTTNLPGARYEVTAPLPPTSFSDDRFDLVINHSVFTHLNENYQDAWLAELARITRPDGIVVLSFSGRLPFEGYLASLDSSAADTCKKRLAQDGMIVIHSETDDGFPDFYHSTFHDPTYVMEHWQEWFDLLAYIPRNNLDFQDAVVMRPVTRDSPSRPVHRDVGLATNSPDTIDMPVSNLERRLVLVKRRGMGTARSMLARLRGSAG